MSSSESDSRNASTSYDLSPETIIKEVQKRPALYNRASPHYKDRQVKAALWEEVNQAVCSDYESLSKEEKRFRGERIAKKWKNLRDSYKRELVQRSGKSGPKKRKYVYFELLSFLAATIEMQEATSAAMFRPQPKGNENAESYSLNELKRDTSSERTKKKQQPTLTNHDPAAKSDGDFENQLLDILRKKSQDDEDDEEKSFIQMILVMMRKLNDEQRHYAKVEILNVMQTAKSYPFTFRAQ